MSTQAIEKAAPQKSSATADWSANIPVQVQNLTSSTITSVMIYHLWQTGKVAEIAFTAASIASNQTQGGGSINSGSGGYDNWIVFFFLEGNPVLQSTGVVEAQVYQPNTGQFIQVQIQGDGTCTFNVYGKDASVPWGPAYNEFPVQS